MTSIDAPPALPGRLGSPAMLLKDDPRADPRMVAAMAPLGLDGAPEPAPVDADSSIEALLEYCSEVEAGFGLMFDALFADLPAVDGVISVEISERRARGRATDIQNLLPEKRPVPVARDKGNTTASAVRGDDVGNIIT